MRLDFRALVMLACVPLLGCPAADDDDDTDDDDLAECAPVDLVFAMDTSGSMDDEAEALCSFIGGLESDLRARGLQDLRIVTLGIVEGADFSDRSPGNPPGEAFSCLEGSVYRYLGGDGVTPIPVPGDPPEPVMVGGDLFDPTVLDPRGPESDEYWGSAVALLADGFDWTPGARTLRVVVPMSDESPMTGARTCHPVDQAVIDNASAVAQANGVIVSPIIGSLDDQDECIPALGQQLAEQTGGSFQFADDADALEDAVVSIVEAACDS